MGLFACSPVSCDPGCGKNYCCLLETGQIKPDGTPNSSPVPKSSSIPENIKP